MNSLINIRLFLRNNFKYIYHVVYIIVILTLVFVFWFTSNNTFNIDKYSKLEEYNSFSYDLNAIISISEQIEDSEEESTLKNMYVSSNGAIDIINGKHISKDTYNVNSFDYFVESYGNKNTFYYYSPSFINKYIIRDDIYSFNKYLSRSILLSKTFPENITDIYVNDVNEVDVVIDEEIVRCKKIDLNLTDSDQYNVINDYIHLLSQKHVFFDLEKPLSALQKIEINSITFSVFECESEIRKIEFSSFINSNDKIISIYYSIELYDINETEVTGYPTLNDTNSVKESSILQAVG